MLIGRSLRKVDGAMLEHHHVIILWHPDYVISGKLQVFYCATYLVLAAGRKSNDVSFLKDNNLRVTALTQIAAPFQNRMAVAPVFSMRMAITKPSATKPRTPGTARKPLMTF